MAKKSKKSTKSITKILRILSCIAFIPVLIVPFLSIFAWQTSTPNTSVLSDGIGLFGDWSGVESMYKLAGGELNNIFITITSIALVALCVVGVVYMLLVILSFVKPKSKLISKLLKLFACVVLVLSILTTVLLLITPLMTSYTFKLIVDNTYRIVLLGTTYMVIAGILSGIFGVIAERK